MTAAVLERLRALLLAEGGLIATLVASGKLDGHAPEDGAFAHVAASGPRAAGMRGEYELLVEMIYEGYLLHYGEPRVIRCGEADLRLLAGDRLYALGLARLVALEDTFAVSELADTITLSSLAQAAGDPALADAVWAAGARAVGWGPSEPHRHAKQLVLQRAADALAAMRTSAGVAGDRA